MKYDFSSFVSRAGTGSKKWEQMYERNRDIGEGIVPLSVADMEFKNAPEIYSGLMEFLKNQPIIGYTGGTNEYFDSVIDWQNRRHQWNIRKEWIVNTPGVIAAIHVAIRAFSKEDDGVIIFNPVYDPFSRAIEENNRKIISVPLIEKEGDYAIDFYAFEKVAKKQNNKILLFCSPHNPVGRVWTKEELTRLASLAVKNDLLIVSDEIWNDVIHPDYEHTVLHKIDCELQKQLITCTSASKTFNLAGAKISNIIISDTRLRELFVEEAERFHLTSINIFGYEATKIAYNKGEEWLDELLNVIYSNQELVQSYFEEHHPLIEAPVSEGTFIQWINFNKLGVIDSELEKIFNTNCCFSNPGYKYGKEGNGYHRINTALPAKELEKYLSRLSKALQEI